MESNEDARLAIYEEIRNRLAQKDEDSPWSSSGSGWTLSRWTVPAWVHVPRLSQFLVPLKHRPLYVAACLLLAVVLAGFLNSQTPSRTAAHVAADTHTAGAERTIRSAVAADAMTDPGGPDTPLATSHPAPAPDLTPPDDTDPPELAALSGVASEGTVESAALEASAESFFVRVGSFRDHLNADRVVEFLKARQLSVTVELLPGGLHAVVLGPFASRNLADTTARTVHQSMGLDPLVLRRNLR